MKIDFNRPQTNFKSIYPVVHIVKNEHGQLSYADKEARKVINRHFVSILTGSKEKKGIIPFYQSIRDYIARMDISSYNADIAVKNTIRSLHIEDLAPKIYIFSGMHASQLSGYGRRTGAAINRGRDASFFTYYQEGLRLINCDSARLKDGNGYKVILFTYSDVVRNPKNNELQYILNNVMFSVDK